MATTQEYSLLSLYVYDVIREEFNRPHLPTGWTPLEVHSDNILGFSYGVFQRSGTGEIVLAYTGTNGNIGDWVSNFTAAAGLPSWQVSNAALVYQQVKAKYGSNITLSGHSLGGGLASIMATWFNRPAVVFDQAPFQLTAANPIMLDLVKSELALAGYTDAAMDNAISEFTARESQVANHYVAGEILALLRSDATAVAGSDVFINVNSSNMRGVELHSMALLAAIRMSEPFRLATYNSNHILPRIMDEKLYAYGTQTSTEKNFLLDLIRSEQKSATNQGKLTHFTADLNKFGSDISGLNAAAQNAILAQSIEWYYWQGANFSGTEFFTQNGSLLQYTTAQGDDLSGALNKASSYVDKWLTSLLNDAGQFGGNVIFKQWNVNAGTGASTATARDASKSQIYIGNIGTDTFTGGSQADLFLSGEGDDSLNGGGGNDSLYGGTGTDRYTFDAGYGSDVINDQDGQGSVVIGGAVMKGGKKEAGSFFYEDKETNTIYLQFGSRLSIARKGVSGQVTVEDWSNGELGIRLTEGAVKEPRQVVSPIVLDMDGDGVETTGLLAQTHFDHDGDGFAELTGWAAPDDGLLVRDLNGNGQIDSGAELFGSNTMGTNNTLAANGFAALSDLDANKDNLISGAELNTLGVWRDTNQNGKVDQGELLSTVEAGIKSISTNYTNSSTTDANGNQHRQIGSYVSTSDQIRSAVDVWFATDRSDSIAKPLGQPLPADVLALPDIEGYGTTRSLRESMASNSKLKSLVQHFVQASESAIRSSLIKDLLLEWAGASDKAPDSRGQYIEDARWLYMVEGLTGQPYKQLQGTNEGTGDPGPAAAVEIYTTSRTLVELFYGRLMAATHLKALYSAIIPTWNEQTETFLVDYSQVVGLLSSAIALNRAAGSALLSDFMRSLHGQGLATQSTIDQLSQGLSSLGSDIKSRVLTVTLADLRLNHETLEGTPLQDWLVGGEGADAAFGWAGNDALYGGGGNDTLYGEDGDDTLDGGVGNDTMVGGTGNNTYLFGKGDGQDMVNLSGDATAGRLNTLQLKPGVLPSELVIEKVYKSLEVSIAGTADKITFDGVFVNNDPTNADNPLQQIRFADGTTWNLDTLVDKAFAGTAGADYRYGTTTANVMNGQAGDDVLYGQSGNDTLMGGLDNDTLYGEDGDDTLDGGAGKDTMVGGTGNNTYLFGKGDGQDMVNLSGDATAGRLNTLQLKPGVLPSELVVEKVYKSLEVSIAGTADKITFDGVFVNNDPTNADNPLQQIRFADGTTWSLDTLVDKAFAGTAGADYRYGTTTANVMNGQAGDDRLYGDAGDDTLMGGADNDTLYGEDGADALYGEAGYDRLVGGDGNDTLMGGADNDVLDGGGGDDALYGEAGDDDLYGNAGDDTLIGGAGDDWLSGGTGNNTYLFGKGDGHDEVSYSTDNTVGKLNALQLKAGVLPSELLLRPVYSQGHGREASLEVSIAGTADKITFDGVFVNNDPTNADNPLQQIRFADGTTWNLDTLVEKAFAGTAGEDYMYGTTTANVMNGQAGDDRLYGDAGDDTLMGGADNDTLYGEDGADALYGEAGNDSLIGGGDAGADTLDGGDGNDKLYGDDGDDHLDGGTGNDHLYAGTGADTLNGGAGLDELNGGDGHDQLIGGAGDDLLRGQEGNDSLEGGDGDDILSGGDGADILDGGAGNDTLYGGTGSNVYRFGKGDGLDVIEPSSLSAPNQLSELQFENDIASTEVIVRQIYKNSEYCLELDIFNAGDKVTINGFFDQFDSGSYESPVQQVRFADGNTWDTATLLQKAFTGTSLSDKITGTVLSDKILGQDGSDSLFGRDGNDTLMGGADKDSLYGEDGADALYGGAGYDLLYGDAGADTLDGGDGNDVLIGGYGDDTLDGGAGDDWLSGGTGNNTYLFGKGDGQDTVTYSWDTTVGKLNTLQLKAGVLPSELMLKQAYIQNFGSGASLEVSIAGTADKITFDGVFVNNDPTNADNPLQQIRFADGTTWNLDTLVEKAFAGTAGEDYMYGTTTANVMNGQAGADFLNAGAGNDTLDGGVGNDTMLGGAGDDVYVVNVAADRVTENANEGTDTVQSSVTYTLGNNVENLTLTGTTAINGTGNALNNVLTGNGANNNLNAGAGNDTLDGGVGNDTMIGGAGDDVYVVNVATDVVTENANEGVDTVQSSVTYTLGNNLENLTLTGATAINGTGNALNNVLTGNSANNTLNGGVGNDTMLGGAGDDTYVVDAAADVVTENANEGVDTVQSSVTYTLGANLENLTLTGTTAINGTGNTLNNLLTGNGANNNLNAGAGNDTLDGGVGNDTMVGGAGDDVYVVNVATDVVTENANEGVDTVQSSVTYTLGNNVENLTLTGTTAINAAGNALNNVLTGNSANNTLNGGVGNDTLDGGVGNDTMIGSVGDDVYVVNVATDVVTENANEGTDTVQSSVTYTLGNNVENLALTGTATTGTGNILDNRLMGNNSSNTLNGAAGSDVIFGNDGNDTIDGGSDGDTMYGGAGADTYYIDHIDDLIGDNANDVNTAYTSVSFSFAEQGGGITNIHLTGSNGLAVVGNDLSNRIAGNAGANLINGGAGNDLLIGGTGNDYYIVESDESDTVVELAGEGTDTVETDDINYELGEHVENLVLTSLDLHIAVGNALANVITDGAGLGIVAAEGGNDTVRMGDGDDVAFGGDGDDLLEGGDGDDDLQGDVMSSGIGLAPGNDTLKGGAGNDTLNGGAGNDLLIGGSGNDTYLVDSSQDVVNESSNGGVDDGGIDTVESTVDYALGAFVENLTLTGTTVINGTGNELNNVLTGNGANNTLNGGVGNDKLYGDAGNDALHGGAGQDSLYGGEGDDTFVLASGDGHDLINAYDISGMDTLRIDGATRNDIWLSFDEGGTDLEVHVLGQGRSATIALWDFGSSFQVDQIRLGGTGQVLNANKVADLVQAMSTMAPPPGGLASLSQVDQARIQGAIQAAWA